MTDDREHRALVIAAILVAFALGVLFGALAPRKYLPRQILARREGAEQHAQREGHQDRRNHQRAMLSIIGHPANPFSYAVPRNPQVRHGSCGGHDKLLPTTRLPRQAPRDLVSRPPVRFRLRIPDRESRPATPMTDLVQHPAPPSHTDEHIA